MDYTTSHFAWSFWDNLWIPYDQVSPSQTFRCPDVCDFPPKGTRSQICQLKLVPSISYLRVYMGLHSLSHGPLSSVHFGESLVIRLHSEIGHIHLSSEAQCVSHLYPQVDCHKWSVFTTTEVPKYSHNSTEAMLPLEVNLYHVTLNADGCSILDQQR